MFGSRLQYDKEGLLLCWFSFPTEPPFWLLVTAHESFSPSSCLRSRVLVNCWFLYTRRTSSTRNIGTRLPLTPSIWLFVIGTSHFNANCQSKLAPPRSIPASIRDVSTSPKHTYIQRSHYIPIRHSSAKIDDHGGWQSGNGMQSSTGIFLQLIGHVRPRGGGYVDSWAEATRLSNYWRRFYNIDQVYEDQPGIRKRISLPGILKTINTTMLP